MGGDADGDGAKTVDRRHLRSVSLADGVGEPLVFDERRPVVQTLVRDLVILWKLRRGDGHSAGSQLAHCYCLETPVGMLFLVLAIGIYWASPPGRLDGGWAMVGLGVGATMLINFLLRDLIIQWKPLAIRRDPAHFNIIPKI